MDQDGILIHDACKYLNVTLSNAGFKSREKVYSALKLLYSYCLIFEIDTTLKNFNKKDLNKFLTFLYGGNVKGCIVSLEFNDIRRRETVLGYIRIYHNFFKILFETNDSPFNDFYPPVINGESKAYSEYAFKNVMMPMYFKENEYNEIINIIKQKYTVREHLIIHLMYNFGLRIGEVLGLTSEDLHVSDGMNKLYIRNRVSDMQWQLSKSLLNPKHHSDYQRGIFNEYGSGFQIVKIDKETVNMIDDYLESSRTSPKLMNSDLKLKNLNKYCNADSLDSPTHLSFNQYLFISKNLYKPLTAVGWNSILREIFQKASIQTDKNRRSSNLNHKFRHSFAMNLVKRGLNPNQLAMRLRHKNVTSTYKYYNPDDQDQYELFLKYKDSIGGKYNFEL